MLRRTSDLRDYQLRAQDGDFGKVKEFYFDDQKWVVRYLVADTGGWLGGQRVLISPYALKPAPETDQVIPVNLTREQVERCPSVVMEEPISRRYERQYYAHYGWPMYWAGPYLWGASEFPDRVPMRNTSPTPPEEEGDPHLRSTKEVTGYYIQANDGEMGHIDDFLIEDQSWAIRYLIVDTRNWWPGKKVLLPPTWITSIDWIQSKVFVDLDRPRIQNAPEYIPSIPITRDYEQRLFDHYQREAYWERLRETAASR